MTLGFSKMLLRLLQVLQLLWILTFPSQRNGLLRTTIRKVIARWTLRDLPKGSCTARSYRSAESRAKLAVCQTSTTATLHTLRSPMMHRMAFHSCARIPSAQERDVAFATVKVRSLICCANPTPHQASCLTINHTELQFVACR
jgi:hypothetical protein